jgi:hypothetical protein
MSNASPEPLPGNGDCASEGRLRRVQWLIGLYAVIALLVIPVFPHLPSANEFSRWALTAAIVERGSLEISPEISLLGDRIIDVATVNGRIHSDKAPGGSFLAVPAYALARTVVGPPDANNLRATVTSMRILICTLPLLILCLCLVRQASSAGIAPDRIAFCLGAMLFGTPLFAYGLLLFSHAMTAAALFGAWLLLFGSCRLRESLRELAAGALVGLAAISEYPVAFPGAVLVICALRRRGVAGGLRIAAGALAPLIALALYNRAAFGGVFALSLGFERAAEFRQLHSSSMFGMRFPSPWTAARLLLDPGKGLLLFSPVLVLALVAIPLAWRRLERPAFWALTLAPLTLLLVYAGFSNWNGGWSVGARYLVPAVPFLTYLLLLGRPHAVDAALLGASVAAIAITSLVFPFVSPGYAFPWASFAAPLLAKGLVAPNLLHYLSRSAAIVVPFALVAAALVLAVGARRAPRAGAGIAVWTLVAFLCVATWFPRGDGTRWYVENSYFEQLDVFSSPPPPIDPWTLRQMQMDRLLPPSSWPF